MKGANERKKGIKEDPRAFGLRRWKDGVVILEIGKAIYRIGLRVESGS